MTAPAARTLAEIVKEGRRLEATCRTACDGESAFTIAKAADDLLAFYRRHWPTLLAVAEAADKREATLRAAAREALDVLTRLADSAAYSIRGCSRVSEGCRNCYAEKIAARFSDVGKPFHGFASIGPRKGAHGWTGKVELVPEKLEEPLHWRKPRRVFVNSMSDLFHEKLSLEEIAAVFGVMAVTPHLTYQILTKRPARMLGWFREMGITARRYSERGEVNECHRRAWQAGNEEVAVATSRPASVPWPLPNVWLGVSVEDQKTADERIPLLFEVPAAVRFVSYEPALGPVRFDRIATEELGRLDALRGFHFVDGHNEPVPTPRLDWLIFGGESGAKARPFDVAWARSVVEQCREAGVPCFVKQLGASTVVPAGRLRHHEWPHARFEATDLEHPSTEPWRVRLRDRAGSDPSEWPEDLRVREFPR